MVKLSKNQFDLKTTIEEFKLLKENKIFNFIYDSFKSSSFKDERILRHIVFTSESQYLGEVEMIMFVKEFPNENKSCDNEDYLIMFRFQRSENWEIINFHGLEVSRNFTDEMFAKLMYSIYKAS